MSYELKKPYTDEERLNFIVRYNHQDGLRIEETELYLFALEENEIMGKKEVEGELIDYPIIDPNWEQEQADLRETNFKSKFFYIKNFGWYRRQPKGYQSAVESMNVLYNIANIEVEGEPQGIQAGLIIFYQAPDFTKPEECTEEWLVAHQIILPAMTRDQFMLLYVAFMTAWNTEEH